MSDHDREWLEMAQLEETWSEDEMKRFKDYVKPMLGLAALLLVGMLVVFGYLFGGA